MFNRGDGRDIISGEQTNSYNDSRFGTDKIIFGEEIVKGEISVSREDYYNLVIKIGDTGDRITLNNYFSSSYSSAYPIINPVKFLEFFDGSSLNLTKGLPFAGTAVADKIEGTSKNDTLMGLGGDDTLIGYQDNWMRVGKGTMPFRNRSFGDDDYIFNLGDGQDTITENYGWADEIVFGIGITSDELNFTRFGQNLVIKIGDGTDPDHPARILCK